MSIPTKDISESLLNEVIQLRRTLHQNPELSEQEYETSKRIQEYLKSYGIPFKSGFGETGVLGVIEGEKPGGVVCLRADIDALPIQEKTDLEFKSVVENQMHACGHDAHTAMLVGVGKMLHDMKAEIEGTVLLLFQPAEENAPFGGAQQMIDDGVFDEVEPDVMVAQHVWPDLPVGKFGVVPGAIMGNSDRFTIKVKGSGGHASMPHQTVDAIIVATHIIQALQTIISRNVDPASPSVITVGKMESGYRYNVIADEATLEGTVRSSSDETKQLLKRKFFETVEGVAKTMGATVEIDYMDGYPATINTPEWAEQVKVSARNKYGEGSVPNVNPSLGGEDFGRFLQKYPGVYYWLGVRVGKNQKPLHDPGFKMDEDAMEYGVNFMVQATVDILEQINHK
ncbi:amidohydrolase [Halalkalibacillus sediminis]|uniref:Amidohydrolase n=1 Tax=Halalkalibacillus sediminis TaxID=2018042 RepID=A0A2I0QU79_9BACI|nr:M20 family metallopeptidase [Halalkalibacillus sediminis]PKR77868.1 amidohydrolase [Halalkalibacillus sediminis]